MAAINWAFFCDYAFSARGKLSIIGIFEEINVFQLPAVHHQLFVVINMSLTPQDGGVGCSAQIATPNGDRVLGRADSSRIATRDSLMHNSIIFAFYQLELDQTGEYHTEIFINDQSIHFMPLNVKLIQDLSPEARRNLF